MRGETRVEQSSGLLPQRPVPLNAGQGPRHKKNERLPNRLLNDVSLITNEIQALQKHLNQFCFRLLRKPDNIFILPPLRAQRCSKIIIIIISVYKSHKCQIQIGNLFEYECFNDYSNRLIWSVKFGCR